MFFISNEKLDSCLLLCYLWLTTVRHAIWQVERKCSIARASPAGQQTGERNLSIMTNGRAKQMSCEKVQAGIRLLFRMCCQFLLVSHFYISPFFMCFEPLFFLCYSWCQHDWGVSSILFTVDADVSQLVSLFISNSGSTFGLLLADFKWARQMETWQESLLSLSLSSHTRRSFN